MNESVEINNLFNCCINVILNDLEYYNDNENAQNLLKYLENNSDDVEE